uniref:Golgi membrane protein 2 n=1 Tax=Ditylenchus dipsaci TaxID=166011 RepID=A0A915DUK0_9BILA
MDANESVRSSEAGSNVGDGCNPSASFVDERSRLERKIEKLREQLTRNSIAREGDVEEYLKNTQGIENMPENPQMVRIRQHFEKKNRKYTQETEQLQKRLEDLEQRLEDLDNGVDPLNRSATHTRVLHNVGHGIRRTGVNLKEMTGSVISAPFDIAQKVKKNMFGSVDNIPAIQDGSNVGHSTFYDGHDQHVNCSKSDRGQIKEDEVKREEEDENLLQPYDAQTRSRLDSTSQKAQIEEC